jgi:hypothetical protein
MRARAAALLLLACSCNAAGSVASPADAGPDATTDSALPPTDDDGGGAPAADAADGGLPPCVDYGSTVLGYTDDCVYAGRCPQDCENGTASAYLCSPIAGFVDAAVTYPSVFSTGGGAFVNVVAAVDAAYPWDAMAYESCGPLSCVRWTTADHLDGGSAWSGDPCADAGDASQAWACPPQPGVIPPASGCTAGAGGVGGSGTGIAANTVWCCLQPSH